MSLFARLLKESTEEEIGSTTPSEEVVPVDGDTAATDLPAEEPEETKKTDGEEAEEGSVQKDLQNIITSILDAIEQESLASGETFEDGESVDVGLEILYKIASKLSDDDAKLAYDELSEYFDMKVEEEPEPEEGEEGDGFEEPAPEGDDAEFEEDKLKESLKKKLRS